MILAAAGLIRLGFQQRISAYLTPEQSLPAIGQGAIGIECRIDDHWVNRLIAPLHDGTTAVCVRAERAMNHRLMGGCQVPVAGYAVLEGDILSLRGLVGEPDGTRILRAEELGSANQAEALGERLAMGLLEQGADAILKTLYARAGH